MPSGGPVEPAAPGRTKASSSVTRNEALRGLACHCEAKFEKATPLESCEPETRSSENVSRMQSFHRGYVERAPGCDDSLAAPGSPKRPLVEQRVRQARGAAQQPIDPLLRLSGNEGLLMQLPERVPADRRKQLVQDQEHGCGDEQAHVNGALADERVGAACPNPEHDERQPDDGHEPNQPCRQALQVGSDLEAPQQTSLSNAIVVRDSRRL
jgi:hypothetical protein